MSKRDKLLVKLFTTPPPKGFAWEELIAVMTHSGFVNFCDGGSHYTFEHATGLRISISRTHPAGLLKPYQIKAAKEAITRTDGAPEKNDGKK
jgi:predicted RNA binding protein YcfA (HicA-like mRNA interferase family)